MIYRVYLFIHQSDGRKVLWCRNLQTAKNKRATKSLLSEWLHITIFRPRLKNQIKKMIYAYFVCTWPHVSTPIFCTCLHSELHPLMALVYSNNSPNYWIYWGIVIQQLCVRMDHIVFKNVCFVSFWLYKRCVLRL